MYNLSESFRGAITVAKTANLSARIEPELKEQAEAILSALGIPASNAIGMFYKQIVLQKGLPFDVKLPDHRLLDIGALTEEQLSAELQAGYEDTVAGRSKPAGEVFASIRRDYGI